MKKFKHLVFVRIKNKGIYFNFKEVAKHTDIQRLGIFDEGYSTKMLNEEKSMVSVKFRLPAEDLQRQLEITFLNYRITTT